jgi:hypothetical protein
MPKKGQHHNDGLNPSKPRGHEKSRGPNHPDRSQPITTQAYKKKETYAKEAYEHSPKTGDPRPRAVHFDPWNDDIREHPDTSTGSTRARDSDLRSGRSGSDSNKSRRTRGY